jgi:glycosyltransferase involved in cell wall biosynthesis
LDYYPNVDGICWFCQEVWPVIRKRKPDAHLSIVGRRPTAAVRRLAKFPGVQVVGPVPDMRPFYARAAVVLAPLRIARGVQNKVLEALAMGKSLVASPQTLAGIIAQPGVHLLQANLPQEWADFVVDLLDHPSRRRLLRDAGRKFVEEHHSWDQCLRPLEQLLAEAPSLSQTRGP